MIEIKCKRCGNVKFFDESSESLQTKPKSINGIAIPKLTDFKAVEHNGKKYVFAIL